MIPVERDPNLDTLFLLDGEIYVVEGNFWVKFVAKRVPVTPQKPHGLDYSLTLHDGKGKRLLGSIMLIRSASVRGLALGPELNTTISIKATGSASTNTKTRCPCWPISGRKLI